MAALTSLLAATSAWRVAPMTRALPSRRMPASSAMTVQVNDLLGVGQAQPHGRQQALPARQQLAALSDELRSGW